MISVSFHSEDRNHFKVVTTLKKSMTIDNYVYPIITINTDQGDATIFPSFDQVRQIKEEIDNLVAEIEAYEQSKFIVEK